MMATSKFFTWTKGDRKHVSAGVISLPAESLSFAGMDPVSVSVCDAYTSSILTQTETYEI
jgi:hypothetical protein